MMTITPNIFDTLFFLITLAVGLDFTWTGVILLRDDDITHVPRFFGYVMIKLTRRNLHKWEHRNKMAELVSIMISLKAYGVYLLWSGPLLIITSVAFLKSRFS